MRVPMSAPTFAFLLLAAGCDCGGARTRDGGSDGVEALDAAELDSGSADAELADASTPDSGSALDAAQADAGAATLTETFASDDSWSAYDSDSGALGLAQQVCPSASQPNCPQGATVYGLAGATWPTNLSAIPGAHWIWAPGITGATPGASFQKFTFSKVFHLPGAPVAGTIFVSADDFAEVFVNGTSVGSIGSVTDISLASAAQKALNQMDISAHLVQGDNTLAVLGQNGPDSYAGATNATYAQNVAGVVFGGTLTYEAPTP